MVCLDAAELIAGADKRLIVGSAAGRLALLEDSCQHRSEDFVPPAAQRYAVGRTGTRLQQAMNSESTWSSWARGELLQPITPISWLSAGMGQRHNLKIILIFAVYQAKREMAKRNLSNTSPRCNTVHRFTDRRVRGDQVDRGLYLRPKPIAESRALGLVPSNVVTKFFFGFSVRANRPRHRPKISRSMRARTSFQSLVWSSPESTAAQRRSISAAQAASTSA